jgi:hypothetical protein
VDTTPLAKDYAFDGNPVDAGFAESGTGPVIPIDNQDVYQDVYQTV